MHLQDFCPVVRVKGICYDGWVYVHTLCMSKEGSDARVWTIRTTPTAIRLALSRGNGALQCGARGVGRQFRQRRDELRQPGIPDPVAGGRDNRPKLLGAAPERPRR